jgi:hypothetical protein
VMETTTEQAWNLCTMAMHVLLRPHNHLREAVALGAAAALAAHLVASRLAVVTAGYRPITSLSLHRPQKKKKERKGSGTSQFVAGEVKHLHPITQTHKEACRPPSAFACSGVLCDSSTDVTVL